VQLEQGSGGTLFLLAGQVADGVKGGGGEGSCLSTHYSKLKLFRKIILQLL